MSIYNLEDARFAQKHYQDLFSGAHRERVVLQVRGPRVRLLKRLQPFLTNISESLKLQPALARVECVLNPVQC